MDYLLFFKVNGAGKLKAVCNGNPVDHISFSSNYTRAFNGKIVAVIESAENAGEISLMVSGGKLIGNEIKIETIN